MPCNGDYMNPTNRELDQSRVETFFDELNGLPFNKDNYRGYHPRAYGHARKQTAFNARVKELCGILKTRDVSKLSLELQIWWRDHQIADAEREVDEKRRIHDEELKFQALSKLTAEERKALGIK